MNIFNSLGSNYNFSFVINHLTSFGENKIRSKLTEFLEKKYGEEVALVYKGREAIRLALRASRLKSGDVGICGFTCFAVYEAIVNEGFNPIYLDIEKDDINFTFETLERVYRRQPNIKALIVQNTLGFYCEIEKISKFCKEKNIILIEDLAHSIGAVYANGEEAGSLSDFVILSFSQDKMIDGVAGGALIVRNKKYKISDIELKAIDATQQSKDRFYPLFTFFIRKTYKIGVGKVLHFILKKTDSLSKPVDNNSAGDIHELPNWYCKSIYDEFLFLDKNLNKRREIAKIYASILDKRIISEKLNDKINSSSNLRFPIFIKNRKNLIEFLKKENIFVSDIWNDAPIAPRKYLSKTSYKMGECQNSEYISERIVNLPTHRNVSKKDAKFIAERINKWMELQ